MTHARILRSSTAIEPLESRIAPALLVQGANLLGGGGPTTGEGSVGDNSLLMVKVLSGQAMVWYNGLVITSISMGPGAKVEVWGNVFGDIVGNLTSDGKLSDSDNNPINGEDGGVLLPNDILGVTIHSTANYPGDVAHIITGGSVSNVDIAGKISGIYAGDGVFRAESAIGSTGTVTSPVSADINPIVPGVQSDFVFQKTSSIFEPGASLNKLELNAGVNLELYAGNGSPGGGAVSGNAAAGGSISNVSIGIAGVASASPIGTPSYHLIAGDGGDGKVGGAGGSILGLLESASTGPVVITAGKGGFGNGGAGGAGGSVVNFDLQSASAQYSITSGDGGPGTPGGAGGKITVGNLANRTPTAGVLITADFNGDHLDDVLVADSGTGQMVLSTANASGGYTQVPQLGSDVTIPGAGSGPVDGLAADVNGDGKLDAVIVYRDGTMAAFINQGFGVFYDSANADFATVSTSLGFTPTKLAALPGGGTYAIAENTDGKGILHGEDFFVDNGGSLKTLAYGSLKLPRTIVDVVGNYAGLSDGNIQQFQIGFTNNAPALLAGQKIAPVISGGLVDLDLDHTGNRLLALSGSGRALAVYDISGGGAVALPSVSLASVPGKPLEAKFIHDNTDPSADDQIVVLTNTVDKSEFALLNPPPAPAPGSPQTQPYTISSVSNSDDLFKNFLPAYSENVAAPSLIALTGPLNTFTEIKNLTSGVQYPLPFASKQVTLTTGAGGTGLDVGTKLGKGGAGGSVITVNIEAQTIKVITGKGGDSNNGAAGAGGSVSNPVASFKTAGGSLVVPEYSAEALLKIDLGNGGTPLGSGGKSASGGAGGGINALVVELIDGEVDLTTGSGGAGKGGVGGAGGDVARLAVASNLGGLSLLTGNGGAGNGSTGDGGRGGAVNNLTFTLSLDENGEQIEDPYAVFVQTGIGGASVGGIGGAGGDVNGASLKLDGADSSLYDVGGNDAHRDSTVSVTFIAGDAGNGGQGGGTGGNIRAVSSVSVFDQVAGGQGQMGYVIMGLFAGKGGDSANGNGGLGGSVALTRPISGITAIDPDAVGADYSIPAFIAQGGSGGNGGLAGGAGGGVSGVTLQNAIIGSNLLIGTTQLYSAALVGGDGGNGLNGNGGDGGTVSKSLVGVNAFILKNLTTLAERANIVDGGFLNVFGGHAGSSANAKGGTGGSVLNSEFGLVSSVSEVGIDLEGGGGGTGKTAGGAGGMLSGLKLNTPQSTSNVSAVLLGGAGGAATSAAGIGGKGGDINGITQAKDYNSSINLIQAGNGGDNLLGKAGAGGNVMNVKTVGFIGRPSDGLNQLGVFDGPFAQGVFAGRGGDGVTDGVNGSISNIVARQIAAMAAAMDSSTHLFAAASKISNVTASLIGFDADSDGVFDTQGAPGASPSSAVPVDGFILAAALSKVTGSRPAFTFMS